MPTTAERAAAFYDKLGDDYISDKDAYLAAYHRKRLTTADTLLRSVVSGGRLFDFGCGSGDLFPLLQGFDCTGCDISAEMVRLCRERTGVDCAIGGIETFEGVAGPLDAIVCLNTLPYLTSSDERRFLVHAASALRPGGALLISHTNLLFDLVTFNRYTVDFYRDVLLPAIEIDGTAADPIFRSLLADPDFPARQDRGPGEIGPNVQVSDRDALDKRRVDPFTYPREVEAFGFTLRTLRPLNAYPVPPRIAHGQEFAPIADQPEWADRLPDTLARIMSTQFQALFIR